MRVIGGSLRGRKLTPMRGMAIRPTADRIREAVFNILGAKPIDAVVLDLFAGSGALGIEALSRGASQAVFVDQAVTALNIVRKNLQLCRLENRTRVIQWDIAKNLNCLQSYRHTIDLIFIDPPYQRQLIAPALTHLAALQLATEDAIAVVEHDPEETFDPLPSPWALTDQRRYGRTLISFLRRQSTDGSNNPA